MGLGRALTWGYPHEMSDVTQGLVRRPVSTPDPAPAAVPTLSAEAGAPVAWQAEVGRQFVHLAPLAAGGAGRALADAYLRACATDSNGNAITEMTANLVASAAVMASDPGVDQNHRLAAILVGDRLVDRLVEGKAGQAAARDKPHGRAIKILSIGATLALAWHYLGPRKSDGPRPPAA